MDMSVLDLERQTEAEEDRESQSERVTVGRQRRRNSVFKWCGILGHGEPHQVL